MCDRRIQHADAVALKAKQTNKNPSLETLFVGKFTRELSVPIIQKILQTTLSAKSVQKVLFCFHLNICGKCLHLKYLVEKNTIPSWPTDIILLVSVYSLKREG